MEAKTKYKPTPIAVALSQLQDNILNKFGPMFIKLSYQVNMFKGLTFAWVAALMYFLENTSTGMWLYLFLHSTYGFLWLIKDFFFPDARLQLQGSVGSHLLLLAVLSAYWMIPVPLVLGYGIDNPSLARIVALLVLYLTGVTLMIGSDYQKNTTLLRKKGLISDGFFKYTRNPNYLGETMIYLSFCLCAGHVFSFLAFLLPAVPLFAFNIYIKEEISFKAKEGYPEYRNQSNIFLPKLSQNTALEWLIYLVLFSGLAYFFWLQTPSTFFYPFDTYLYNL